MKGLKTIPLNAFIDFVEEHALHRVPGFDHHGGHLAGLKNRNPRLEITHLQLIASRLVATDLLQPETRPRCAGNALAIVKPLQTGVIDLRQLHCEGGGAPFLDGPQGR